MSQMGEETTDIVLSPLRKMDQNSKIKLLKT